LTGDSSPVRLTADEGSRQRLPEFSPDTVEPISTLEAILRRDRQVVAVTLVIVIAACWLSLLTGAGTGMYPHEMAALNPAVPEMDSPVPDGAGPARHRMPAQYPGWTPGYALLMFWMWWLMMTAMMLPSAAPVVLTHAAITRKGLARADDTGPNALSQQLLWATTAFVAGYLVMWGLFSLVAVAAQWALERSALLSPRMMPISRLLGSVLLLAAGLWQLTPLKSACLRHCRSPVGFISAHWRPGTGGAFLMGTEHGVFCLGCCWFLMALLFYAGIMNLAWIIGLALFVLAEKTMPVGVAFGRVAGLLFIAWGAWLGFTTF
jgi:predicted metal-binding membrane protein